MPGKGILGKRLPVSKSAPKKKFAPSKPVTRRAPKAAPKAASNAPKTSTRGMSAAKRGKQSRSSIRDMPDAPTKTKPTSKKTPGVRKLAKPIMRNSKRGR